MITSSTRLKNTTVIRRKNADLTACCPRLALICLFRSPTKVIPAEVQAQVIMAQSQAREDIMDLNQLRQDRSAQDLLTMDQRMMDL